MQRRVGGTVARSERAFFGVAALLFAGSAALTVVWCASMSAMAGMPIATAVERLAPNGERVARITGAVVIGAGLLLIARALAV